MDEVPSLSKVRGRTMGRKERDSIRLRLMRLQPGRTGTPGERIMGAAARGLLGAVLLAWLPACDGYRPVSPRAKAPAGPREEVAVFGQSRTSSYPNAADYVDAPEPPRPSVPGAGLLPAVSRPAAVPVPARHTVAKGDTLTSIGRRYGMSVKALKAANGLTSDLIIPGAVLTIPGRN